MKTDAVILCPQCKNQITDLELKRCPRCNKILQEHPTCNGCGKCSAGKFTKN